MSHAQDRGSEPWIMPAWMEPYRELFVTGGHDVEALHNGTAPVAATTMGARLAAGVRAQAILLTRLYERGELGGLRERDELRGATERVRALTASRLGPGVGRQILAHADRGDSPDVIFYAGASLMLAVVRRTLDEQPAGGES
jgi:hypothetical protein